MSQQQRWNASHYNVVVLGDGGVGKTCLTSRLCFQSFIEVYDPTLEDSYRKQCHVDDRTCILEVLDTAGQEEYTALREQWIRDGDAYLLVYSIASRASFEGIRKFYRQMLQVKRFPPDIPLPVILVANKCDLPTNRVVSAQEGEALAKELRMGFVETSAKDGTNVERAFFDAVRRFWKHQEEETKGFDEHGGRKSSRSANPGHGTKWKGRLTRLFGSKHGTGMGGVPPARSKVGQQRQGGSHV